VSSAAPHPAPEQLLALAEGVLPEPSLAEVRGHVSACAECQERVRVSLGQTSTPHPSDTVASGQGRLTARSQGEVAPGEKVGRYWVLRRIGAGGMGVVYAAYDADLDRRVALKLLRPEAGGSQGKERLLREAQALAKLSHPNVVHVHDVGLLGDNVFVAMELVEGSSFREWLRAPHTWREKRGVLVAAGQGLLAAHRAGLVHRDFKPENVAVGDDGSVRVLDFGLARAEVAPATVSASADVQIGLTQAGAIMGTPGFMCPEQYRGEPCDARGDQFSFCASAWLAFFDQLPFAGVTLAQLSRSAQAGEIQPVPESADVPAWIPPLLRKGLSPAPADRFADLEVLLGALERDPLPWWRRAAPAAVAIAVVAVLVLAVGSSIRARRQHLLECTAQAAQLQGVWDETRRTEVRATFEALPAAFARDAFERAAGSLDQYAAEWAQAMRGGCMAKDRAASALQTVCLQRRLDALREVTGVLAQADAQIAENAVDVVGRLPPVADCARPDAREAWVEPPPAQSAREVEGIRQRLVRGRALESAGKYADALKEAERAVEAAQPLAYHPVIAEAELLQGRAQRRLQRYPSALATLKAAGLQAASARALPLLAEIWIQAALSAGADGTKLDVGELYAEQARALLDGLPRVPTLEADYQIASGNLKHARKDEEGALASYEQALALRKQALRPGDPEIGVALNNVGVIDNRLGRYDAAERSFREAISLFESALGPRHPRLLEPLSNLDICLRRQGHPEEALGFARRAAELSRATYGASHSAYGRALYNLGLVELDLGQREDARRDWTQALELRRRLEGPEGQGAASVLGALAGLEHEEGACGQALTAFDSVLRVRRLPPKPDPAAIANALSDVGCEQIDTGRTAQGMQTLNQAIAQFPQPPDPAGEHGRARFCMAKALWKQEPARAHQLLEGAHAWLEENRAHNHGSLKEVEAWMAEHGVVSTP
jgi:tetratricopeptide (TPR) repeat protein